MRRRDCISFDEAGHQVTLGLSDAQLSRIRQLRADVFCRELEWVGSRNDVEELDEFDAGSTPVAVLDEHAEIVGSVRLTSFEHPWMLESVFRGLAPAHLVRKTADSAEASRLLVTRRSRNARAAGIRVCDLVYKAAYMYCRLNSIRYLYMVTSVGVLRHLRGSGLPCEPLAAPRLMDDGVNAVAVRLDWDSLDRNPSMAAWYNSGWQWAKTG